VRWKGKVSWKVPGSGGSNCEGIPLQRYIGLYSNRILSNKDRI
jgi:hypothetical protein